MYGAVPVQALQHVRRMRGGAQAHLMRASDTHFYVVKFQNNPQHLRVLANDLFASRLAEHVGLPVAATEIVEVGDWLVSHSPELRMEIGNQKLPCHVGLEFGSHYVLEPGAGEVFDYLPEPLLERLPHLNAFAGMLAFDKWTGNANGRQTVFWRRAGQRYYNFSFIDQGYCFNAGEWTFPDSPLRGVFLRNAVYANVRGWESFEPWLSQLEQTDVNEIWRIAGSVPPEWYENDWDAMEQLVAALAARRGKIRELIDDFRRSSRQPFPNWVVSTAVAKAAHAVAGAAAQSNSKYWN